MMKSDLSWGVAMRGSAAAVLSFFFLSIALANANAEEAARAGLFANPTISQPRLSPSGRHIAFVYSGSDIQKVFVRPRVGQETVPVADFALEEVRLTKLWWANSERLLLEGQDIDPRGPAGPLVSRFYAVNRERPRAELLGRNWPDRGLGWLKAQITHPDRVLHRLPDDRDGVLVSHLTFGAKAPSVSRMSVYSGRLRDVQGELPNVDSFFADASGRVRAAEAIGRSADGRSYTLLARKRVNEPLTVVSESVEALAPAIRFAGFHDDPGTIYVLAEKDGRDALYEFDLASAVIGREVYAHPRFDVLGVHLDPTSGRAVGARYEAETGEVAWFDDADREEHELIVRSLHSVDPYTTSHRIVSTTKSGDIAIVAAEGDARPPLYYAYHRERKEMNFVFAEREGTAVDTLVERESITLEMPDGSTRGGFLTLPATDGAGALPPLVVLAPEGPGDRALRGFDPVVQFFASRGFAVLEVDTLGSRGLGRAFHRSGLEEWGMAMNRDLDWAVDALAATGRVDGERVVIYGQGLGGTLALRALAASPTRYRAAASYGGVMDFEAQWRAYAKPLQPFAMAAASLPPVSAGQEKEAPDATEATREPVAETTEEAVEAPAPPSRNRFAPIAMVDAIDGAVLLGHGARDFRVPVGQSRAMAEALEVAGKRVALIEYATEFDGFAIDRNRIDFHDRVIEWFEQAVAPPVASPDPAPEEPTPESEVGTSEPGASEDG